MKKNLKRCTKVVNHEGSLKQSFLKTQLLYFLKESGQLRR